MPVSSKFYCCQHCPPSGQPGRALLHMREGAWWGGTNGDLNHWTQTSRSNHLAQHRSLQVCNSQCIEETHWCIPGITWEKGTNVLFSWGASSSCLASDGCSGSHLATIVGSQAAQVWAVTLLTFVLFYIFIFVIAHLIAYVKIHPWWEKVVDKTQLIIRCKIFSLLDAILAFLVCFNQYE